MEKFIEKHSDKISGVLDCFDRILLKGYLPFPTGRAMEAFFDHNGMLYKDFKPFVMGMSRKIKEHAQAMAEKHKRPFEPIHPRRRKEDLARKIAERDRIESGLVCVFTCVESCSSFALRPGKGKPRLERAPRKCLHLYFYFIDREFGLIHVRLQTWAPFMIQICLNGHSWLARKLDRHGVEYGMIDNAFVSVSDLPRAQRFADAMAAKNWPPALERIARRVNPLLKEILSGLQYYWVIEQAEYSTDVIFKRPSALKELYPALARHAALCFGADDIMSFLGRKLHGNFNGEARTDFGKRELGLRVRHVVAGNSIKMYDKRRVVLRVETTINRSREFKVLAEAARNGETSLRWRPMGKGVANFRRYAQVCRNANHKYLQSLAVVDDPTRAYGDLHRLCGPASFAKRRRRGLNPLRVDDSALFAAVMRGAHAIKGFSNRSLRKILYPTKARSKAEERRRSQAVTRRIHLLRAHKLVAKIPHTHRYRITVKGARLMASAIHLGCEYLPDRITRLAV